MWLFNFSSGFWILLVVLNSLSFSSSVKLLIVQSNLNENLAVQCVLDCIFFLFIVFNICQSLLACRVCSEKWKESQIMCFMGSCRLRKTLDSCLLVGGAVFPSCLLFGLRCPSIGSYRLVLVRKWQLPRALLPTSTPQHCQYQSVSCSHPLRPHGTFQD